MIIKLTTNYGAPLWVNTEYIIEMEQLGEGTMINEAMLGTRIVKETPQEILRRGREAEEAM